MIAPIIFTHYGITDYLAYTLRQATRTNPDKPRILVGDSANHQIALANGWMHTDINSLGSTKRDMFNARFRWVQGKHHVPVKGGKDWLRYVFERFFVIEEFLNRNNVKSFWHFDSDTMILMPLTSFED